MNYMTVKEAGEKWGLGTRIVTLYCVEGRIPGALKKGNLWLIPADAARPADKRRKQAPPQKSLSSDLDEIIAATTVPMPGHNPDAILDAFTEERLYLQYESVLAYLRGEFQRAQACFRKTEETTRPGCAPVRWPLPRPSAWETTRLTQKLIPT